MSWPDLAALELLALTAEQGSLSRAAAACGVAQPNASRTIARLERQLGQALIVRTTTGSRLTPTGALIVRWAEPLLKTGAEFASAVAALRHDHAHELSILASQTVAECWAPAWLAGFHRVADERADHDRLASRAGSPWLSGRPCSVVNKRTSGESPSCDQVSRTTPA